MSTVVFEKVLVANRGEIALRVMRTLKKMGIISVAVYSEADINSLHVQYADEAYYIGNASAAESYLSIKNIMAAVRDSGAKAVHPGYGFLAENHKFATVLKQEGIALIGPSPKVIRSMGDKVEAKKIAIESGVSTVPGYMGTINSLDEAIKIATEIGFPIIIKAAAGGGGRGMRVVQNAEDMERAYESAKLEAENCFSDNRVFIEKLISTPRHIEIQILGDQHGNIICLGERECSIQRYHQKVIEEAPSPFLDDKTREKMYEQSIALAKKVGYYSAGTVEFMVDKERNFYFLEMNTRLQVEHPVTEMVTGLDIVEQMILIAAGQKLEITQNDVKINGWAIEARICAEDPTRRFLPSSGRILDYQEPANDHNIRVDSGVSSGGEISMYYDSMIAKLCAYGGNREEAINRISKALSKFVIQGIAHNINFLEALINNSRFISGNIHTGFISEEYPEGFSGLQLTSKSTAIFLSIAVFIHIEHEKRAAKISNISTFNQIGTRWVATLSDMQFPLLIKYMDDGLHIKYSNNRVYISSNWSLGCHLFSCIINGQKINAKVGNISTGYRITYSGNTVDVYVRSPRVSELESLMITHDNKSNRKELMAPLTGQIISISVFVGDDVIIGQPLCILSAMKMENIILSERNGRVSKILAQQNDQVICGQIILEFE